MTKQAAEHLAQEYYTFGQELALDNFSKTAGLPKDVIKKLVQATTAGVGAGAGAVGSGLAAESIIKNLGIDIGSELAPVLPLALAGTGILASVGGGAMLGSHLAGKGVDLTERGLAKLLSKIKK